MSAGRQEGLIRGPSLKKVTKVSLSQLEKQQRETKRKSGQKRPRKYDYKPSQDFASAFATEVDDDTGDVEGEETENSRKKVRTEVGAKEPIGGEGTGIKGKGKMQVCGICGIEKSRANMSRHKKKCGQYLS